MLSRLIAALLFCRFKVAIIPLPIILDGVKHRRKSLEKILGMLSLALLWGCGFFTAAAPDVSLLPSFATATPSIPAAPPPAGETPPAICPPERAVEFPSRPDALAEFPATLARYLDAGAAPDTLPALLSAWNALPLTGAAALSADVTGDAVSETLVSLTDPISGEALLALYICQRGEVRALYTYRPGPRYRLHLIAVSDLTADDRAEVLFSEVTCGEAICWHALHAWAWNGTDFVERMSGGVPYPDPVYAVDAGRLSVGATVSETWRTGPQRPHTTTLAWDGAAITPTGTLVGPARYRVHALFDGDAALVLGDAEAARVAYQRVLDDEELFAWDALFSSEEELRWLTALAHWRLLLLDAIQGDAGAARTRYERLQSAFDTVGAGYPVAQLAHDFWRSYQEQQALAYGCAAVARSEHARDVVDFLNSYGYANPTYTAEMLCPF